MNASECRFHAHAELPPDRRLTGRRWLLILGALIGSLLAAPIAGATPEVALKVRGAATITAVARGTEGLLEVRGSIADDAGRPLGRAHLRIKLVGKSGYLTLPVGEKCPPSTRVELARGYSNIPDSYIVETDPSGGFCLRVAEQLAAQKVELMFNDDRGLFEPATETILVDSTRRVLSLAFSQPALGWNLGHAEHTLALNTKLKPPLPEGASPETVRVDLLLSEPNNTQRKIGSSVLPAGGTTRFQVPSEQLGAPGRATLKAVFPGSEGIQPAERSLVISKTAQVQLTLAEAQTGSWTTTPRLSVAVGYIGGAVPGGSVEARVMGQTVGIAPVHAGAAEVHVHVESSRRHEVTVTLHYLPDAPWWLPGPPLEASVPTISPSGWVRWTWVVLAGLVAGWTMLAWRRPRRRSNKRQEVGAPPPGETKLEVLQPARIPNSGWRGRVIDAHDGYAIGQAEVTIIGPSFRSHDVVQRTWTTAEGGFSLEAIPRPWPEGARLRVSSTTHTSMEQPLPVEGEIAVHLMTRRRSLLMRLGRWIERRGRPYSDLIAATPGQVRSTAERQRESDVADWARGVENAAYGPTPPDEDVEQSLISREPGPEPGR